MGLWVSVLLAGCAATPPVNSTLPTTLAGWEARAKASPGNQDLQLRLASEYMQYGKYDEAAEAYKKSYGGNSALAETWAWHYVAGAYRAAGKLDAAIAAQKRAAELKPDHADHYSFLALLYYENKKYDESITAAKQAISIQPTHATAHNIAGASYEEKGAVQEAMAFFRKAAELAPKEPENYIRLGNLLLREKRPTEALSAYSKAVEVAPENALALNGVGVTYYLMGRYDEAIPYVSRAIEASTTNGIGINVSGGGTFPMIAGVVDGLPAAKAGLKKGDAVIAVNGQSTRDWGNDIPKFVQAVRGAAGTPVLLTVERQGQNIEATLTREKILLKNAALYYANRSLCYNAKGDAAMAMEDARAAVAIGPKDINAIFALACAQVQQNQFEEALQTVKPLTSSVALLVKATALAKLSRTQEAAEVYGAINPSDVFLSFVPHAAKRKNFLDAMRPYVAENVNRARTLESKSQYREALAAYSAAMKAADETEAKEILSACFAMVRKNPALGQVSEEARKFAIRSEVMVKEGNFAEGLSEIRKAIAEAPYIGQFFYNAALIQAEMKKYREAIRDMNVFLAAAPDSPHARAARDEIIKWELMIEKGK